MDPTPPPEREPGPDPYELFTGARRHQGYDEGAADRLARKLDQDAAEADAAGLPRLVPLAPVEVAYAVPASEAVAPTRRRKGFFSRFGGQRFPTEEDDRAFFVAETKARQFTAMRSVNVLVANQKGGVGKTTTALVLGGVLGTVRGGSVAIVEMTPAPGDLADRAEGTQARGLGELAARAHEVASAGNLAAFTAPQTSMATVIGSSAPRGELQSEDVVGMREVLDRYFQITISDSGNNVLAPLFMTTVASADVLVVPVTRSLASLRGAQAVANAIWAHPDPVARRVLDRVVVVATHDGGPEDADLVEDFLQIVHGLFPGAMAVVDVPYDEALRIDNKELAVGTLSQRSQYAWRQVAGSVVDALRASPGVLPASPPPYRPLA